MEPEQDLFVWTEKSRPFKERTRQYYITLFSIVGLVGLILFIAEGAMPVALLAAITFLFYVLSTVSPEEITYKITNKGIKIANKLNEWGVLGRFWFSNRLGSPILVVETSIIPGRIELVFKEENKADIRKALSKYLTEEEIKPSGIEKISDWVSSKLPGNKV